VAVLGGLAHLLVELLHAGHAAAADGLVGARDDPDQLRLVVQRLEHRHRAMVVQLGFATMPLRPRAARAG
jgi:hypothetical protein